MSNDLCPASAPFFGFMGAAVALVFASTPPPQPTSQNMCAESHMPAQSAERRSRRGRERTARARTPHPLPRCSRADLGAAYGTAKSGVGVSSMGVMKPDLVMKSIIPVVMAGVLGIYGLIIAVIIANGGA